MSSKYRVTVNLSDEEYLTLNELASRSKVSKAWLVRHAVGELLDSASNDDKQLSLPLQAIKRKGA